MYSQPWSPTASDDGVRAGVADREPLARPAPDIDFPGSRAVQGRVADDDVLVRHEGRAGGRRNDDLAAGQAFAEIVVGVAVQQQRHARRDKCAERLARRAVERQLDGVFRQPLRRRSGG